MKVAVIGGGAAGFFAALAIKEHHLDAEVTIFEQSAKVLSKVAISGGGRCNVTHACFDPRALVQHYPRGHKELLGPFHRFGPRETIEWFAARGVLLKEEADGRMFPITDSSQTIIDCFLSETKKLGIEVRYRAKLTAIEPGFKLTFAEEPPLGFDRVVMATGSSPAGWEFARQLGHSIVSPIPSLFAFNVPHSPLAELSGVAVADAIATCGPFEQRGAILITHLGFSGPAILKLSAWAARWLFERQYQFTLKINWVPGEGILPKRLGRVLDQPSETQYEVNGKTTNKQEFVTCGGVELSEVNFKNMESKRCPGLFFCGEVLNIDGVTGGFNFQNAWTTAWLASF